MDFDASMKNFEQLIKECEADLESIGIKIGNVVKYSINTRAKSRWGQCKQVGENRFEINISQRLLSDDVSDRAAKDTILHEMLHTVEGCMGHKGRWKELAQKVNAQLPQYKIKRVTSAAEKGINDNKDLDSAVLEAKPIKKSRKNKKDKLKFSYLTFIFSIVGLVTYIKLVFYIKALDNYPSEEATALLISKGYLPLLLLVSAIGFVCSVLTIKKSANHQIVKLSKVFALVFLILFFLSFNVVLG